MILLYYLLGYISYRVLDNIIDMTTSIAQYVVTIFQTKAKRLTEQDNNKPSIGFEKEDQQQNDQMQE